MSQPPWGSAGPGNGPGPGSGPGYGQNQGPGPGYGPSPGYGQNQGPGYGQNQGPGYGQNQGPDYGRNQGNGPGYGQNPGPGYGQNQGYRQGYGPNQAYGPGPTPAQYGPRPTRGVGIPGVVIAAVGGLIMAVGFFAPWYSANGQSSYLKDAAKAAGLDGVKALPAAYFGWLLWVLFALTVVAAFVACLPTGASIAMRIIAPILGVLGVVLLFAALNSGRPDGAPGPFEHASIGLFATVVGFLVVGAGGVFGPSARRQ